MTSRTVKAVPLFVILRSEEAASFSAALWTGPEALSCLELKMADAPMVVTSSTNLRLWEETEGEASFEQTATAQLFFWPAEMCNEA